jgi:hypothetical protein
LASTTVVTRPVPSVGEGAVALEKRRDVGHDAIVGHVRRGGERQICRKP